MTIRERILSLLSREVRVAYLARDAAIKISDAAMDKNARTGKILDRALREVDILTEVSEHWRSEANTKHKLFADIAKEVESAEDLHQLKQIVRMMAYHAENSGIIVQTPDEEPKVVVTNERVI